MDKETAVKYGLGLIKNSNIAMVRTVDNEGYPNIKEMLKLLNDGIKTIWFSTNTSSKIVTKILKDKRASVYFVNQDNIMGFMLIGEMELLQDEDSKKMLWSEGCEKYYQQDIDDQDCCVLKFTAKKGNFYKGLVNINFDIE